jgi:prepilin-type N-terminal cleavage/methylation domain-containing protein
MKKGFTLLEILLVIAAIGVLAAIVIVALNPTRQLSQVRNTTRRSDINNLAKAFDQYLIDEGSYPSGLTSSYQELCFQDASDCTGLLDVRSDMAPRYLAGVPRDPSLNGNNSGYRVAINPDNNKISIKVLTPELGESISINPVSEFILYAWGLNNNGQLGDASQNNSATPLRIDETSSWLDVSANGNFSIAVRSDGTLWTWGENDYGQLGNGLSSGFVSSPTRIGNDTDWSDVEAGLDHGIALKEDGTLWGWGRNDYYQLGLNDTNPRLSPTQIGSDSDWVRIDSGWHHTLALKSDNTLHSWGFNSDGQIGNATTTNRQTPGPVGSANDWVEFSAGPLNSFAINTSNNLYAWGDNFFRQLGDGSSSSTNRLTPVLLPNQWRYVDSGQTISAGITQSNELYTWGYNGFDGSLGTGSSFPFYQSTPARVGSDTDWDELNVGSSLGFARKLDGAWFSWGSNGIGQLGNGNPGVSNPL